MTDSTQPDTATGENVRRLRTWRGKDQATIAGLAGRSQGWLSRIETGQARLDRRTDIEALADALEVHPGDLIDGPWRPAKSRNYEVDVLVPAVRVAMVDAVPDARPLPVAELTRRVGVAARVMWRDGDLVALAAALPGLIGAVRLAAGNGGTEEDHQQALRLLAVTCSTAFPMLKHCGYPDLALAASNMCTAAVEPLLEEPWQAYAGVRRSHALIPAGAPERALMIAQHAVDVVEPHVGGSDSAARMYGFAHLTAAVWAAYAQRRENADAHLAEAAAVAERLPDHDWFDIYFGPANVAIHRAQVAAALGDGERLPALAAAVDEAAVPSAVQRSYLHTYVGHGLLGVRGRADDAVRELRLAETLAPVRFRTRMIVPPMVMDLLGRPMRSSSLRELRGLAYRVGIG
jgi:transcriptional regulator with XRE-family HTH domain